MRRKSLGFALLLVGLTSLALCLAAFVVPARAGSQLDLTSEEVSARFAEIGEKYDVGGVLSEEDAEFVWAYGSSLADVPAACATATVSETATAYGTTVTLKGTVWHTGTYTYNFGGNLTGTVTSGSTPQEMTITVTCQSYGLVGTSTVVMYSGSVTHTTTGSKTVSMNKSANYTGVALIYSINTTLDVTTSSGYGFTVNAS